MLSLSCWWRRINSGHILAATSELSAVQKVESVGRCVWGCACRVQKERHPGAQHGANTKNCDAESRYSSGQAHALPTRSSTTRRPGASALQRVVNRATVTGYSAIGARASQHAAAARISAAPAVVLVFVSRVRRRGRQSAARLSAARYGHRIDGIWRPGGAPPAVGEAAAYFTNARVHGAGRGHWRF